MARSSAAPKANGAAGQVRSYIAAQPARTARELRKLRAAIRSVAPGAVEAFGYGIPGFRLYDQPLVWYAGWTYHTSMYPMTAAIRRGYADELKGYKMATGTVQFPLSGPLPPPNTSSGSAPQNSPRFWKMNETPIALTSGASLGALRKGR